MNLQDFITVIASAILLSSAYLIGYILDQGSKIEKDEDYY